MNQELSRHIDHPGESFMVKPEYVVTSLENFGFIIRNNVEKIGCLSETNWYIMYNLLCREGLEVTDDVSIVEHLKHPVYITEGSYTNIKVVNYILSW
jgi:hypothetical protein